jgi:hypothetical protein
MALPPLAVIVRDRRPQLLSLTVLSSLVLGFVAVPDKQAIALVSHFGYWCVLLAFGLWVWSLWRIWAGEVRAWRWPSLDWVSLVVVALGGVVLLAHEAFGFKIVMDELMLLGTSMSMHLDKTVLTPLRGNDIQGAYMIVEGIVDKRPLFFPFLTSLLHDVFGYRPENAFVLNAGLTFGLLALVCRLGARLAGRAAGWLAVTLMAGLPLLGHNATGGGFELLNLTMITLTLLLGVRWVERRDEATLSAFCFSAILLAQVRYESVIFVGPVVLLVLWVWWSEGRIVLSWPVIVAPLLMVHYPLQHRIFDLRASAWEMASKPGYSEPFSLSYVPENLVHALKFFFARASDQPNSVVLSALGCVAVPFFALLVIKRLRALGRETPVNLTVTLFSLGFVVQFGLMMCYFWGKFDDPVIRRLSLPTHLGLVIAVVAVLPSFARPAVVRVLLGLAGLGLIARSVPSMAGHAYSQEYTPGRETAWRREFMAAQPRPDYLMIDNDATLWVTHLVSATPTVVAVKRKADIAFHMRNRTFSDVFVFQRYNIDPDTNRMTLRDGDELGADFVLEPVAERRLQFLTLSRISRVKQIKSGGEVITAPDPITAVVPKSQAAIDRARQQFLESYMKQLP